MNIAFILLVLNPNGFNCKKKGKTPVTIFGTASLGVRLIDAASLQLCQASDTTVCTFATQSWSIAVRGDPGSDIGDPQCAINPETGEEEGFLNPGGMNDLDVAFDTQELADLAGFDCPLDKNEASASLVIKGLLTDGMGIISTAGPFSQLPRRIFAEILYDSRRQ